MKMMRMLQTLAAPAAALALMTGAAHAAPLTVSVANVAPAEGKLYLCLWSQAEKFPNCDKGKPFKRLQVTPTPGAMEVDFGDVPPGRYAISALLDVDGDGGANPNLLGMPSEPYGVSGKPSGMGPPRFDAAAFEHPGPAPSVSMSR